MTDDLSRLSEAQWRARLTPEQFRVTRQGGTEYPFSGEHYRRSEPGQYHCVCCGAHLFDADVKFDAGCGWPCWPGSSASFCQCCPPRRLCCWPPPALPAHRRAYTAGCSATACLAR